MSGKSKGFGQGVILGQNSWRWSCQWRVIYWTEAKLFIKIHQ